MPETDIKTVRRLLRGRRTVHEFAPATPPWRQVRAALDSARFAPNHHFTQPWRFYRLGPRSRQAIIELNARLVTEKKGPQAGASKRARWGEIPGWLLITCQRSDKPLCAREDYAATCCAIQNLMLDLWAQGIGSKWTTGEVTRHAEFFAALDIDPAQEDVVALLWYGYPQTVPRPRRSPLSSRLKLLP